VSAPAKRPRPGSQLSWILRDPRSAVGAAVLALAVAVTVGAPLLTGYGPFDHAGQVFGAPSGAHPFGLDDLGQDVLTQVLYGGRISLLVGITAALVAAVIGGLVGISAGYFGGRADTVLMAVTDYTLIVPGIPLMIAIAAAFGSSLAMIVIMIGVLSWPQTARILRSQVRSVRERTYVRRASVLGVGPARMIRTHVLPQVAPLMIATTVLTVAQAIFVETALAFLGLGDPGRVSWGSMIYNAFDRGAVSAGAWWALIYPGVAVAVVVLACSLVGQAIEAKLNPRSRVPYLSGKRFTVEPVAAEHAAAAAAAPAAATPPLLAVEHLDVWMRNAAGDELHVVRDVSFSLGRADRFALVGESGSGKTTTLMSVLGLLPSNARVRGAIRYEGRDLLAGGEAGMRTVRWKEIAMVFQGSMNSFSPVHTVGAQIVEPMRLHNGASRRAARARAAELVGMVGLPATVLDRYPHELSGGMRQRAAIAMALACDPKVLLADEPTTALDAMVQAQILMLLRRLADELDIAVLLVTHDLASVSLLCGEAAVMQRGALIEQGTVDALYHDPKHPYTRELFGAALDIPVVDAATGKVVPA